MPAGESGAVGRLDRVRQILWLVLAANLFVVVIKLFVGLRAGSLAVLGDAAHSGVDALNNVVGLLAVKVAAEPPDEEHPYGHGKYETLAALAVVSFLSIAGFELVSGAVGRLAGSAAAPQVDSLTFVLLGGTMIVNTLVATGEARAAARLRSPGPQGHRAWPRRARGPAHVRRAQRLQVPRGSLLCQRFRADRAAIGAAHPDRPLMPTA